MLSIFFPGGFMVVWEGNLRLKGYISISVKSSLTFGRTERDLSSYIPEYVHSVFSLNTNVYYIITLSCCKVCVKEL